jgi:serine/threonine protein kinase
MEGTSKRAHTTAFSRGTAGYRAPELLDEDDAKYTNKVDIWAFGCIVHELVFRTKRFVNDLAVSRYAEAASPRAYLSTKILKGIIPPKIGWITLLRILEITLRRDPLRRPAARVVLDLLATPSPTTPQTAREGKEPNLILTNDP